MMKLIGGIVFIVTATGVSAAQTPAPQTPPAQAAAPGSVPAPIDYTRGETWLCRPGRQDACTVDLSTTVVRADGTMTREAWTANPNAPIDCFYVYPTISTDPTDNSDMSADPAEQNVIRMQFARFGSVCRLFAPLYRQVTLAGLRKVMATGDLGAGLSRGLAYDDVSAAWRDYLEHDNRGRGFVLVGHSQGSYLLAELIRREIDGKPAQSRLVSAILLGTTIAVPKGKDVGGSFQTVRTCHAATDTGCLITFSSYRTTVPPPANALFGRVVEADNEAACTNPAALGGGSGELHAYLSTNGTTIVGTSPQKPWLTPEKPIETPWVSVPGLLTARCASNANASGYLEVSVHGDPADPRVDDIAGDLGGGGQVLANWGLHLIDMNVAFGNLLDVVASQARAFGSRKR
jgi:pimeloyl-ACP methyl ester carboxylesterase